MRFVVYNNQLIGYFVKKIKRLKKQTLKSKRINISKLDFADVG